MKLRDLLPEDKQQELFKNKDDPEIKEKLIIHNLKLVLWVAKKYHKTDNPKRELDDLFQEGVIGLIKAIEMYEPSKGTFSNYAVWRIRSSILRAITDKEKTIRIPSYMIQLINQFKKVSNDLEQVLEREPTPKEISIEMGLDVKKVTEIMNIVEDPISLNTIMVGENEDMTLEDTIPDDGPTPDEIAESNVFIEQFKNEFKERLEELQYESIRLFYGIDCPEHTLKEIAKLKDKESTEEIRQAKEKGLRTVRTSRFMQEIKKELDERTSFIRSIDYSQPRVKGGIQLSPVERLVIERERMRNRLLKEIN